MKRITIGDSLKDVVTKLSSGNPGAMRVLFELMSHHPDGMVHMLKFHDYGYYSSLIWLCYKDLCNLDIQKLYILLKENRLKDAIRQKCSEDEKFRKDWEYHVKVLK